MAEERYQANADPTKRSIPAVLNIAREALDRPIEEGLGSHLALIADGGALTYSELERRVDALARGFKGLGIERQELVLVRMSNSFDFAATFLALVKIGALPALANSMLGSAELKPIAAQAEPQIVVTEASRAEAVRELSRSSPLRLVVCAGGAEDGEIPLESLALGDDSPLAAEATGADEPAFIVYTSGTTGKPKGIVHAHRWLVALGDHNRFRLPPEKGDVVMATGEWSFISALGHNLLFALRNGVTGAVLSGRPTAENILATVERHGVTTLFSVATVYRRILALPDFEKRYDISTLRCANSTGEALGEATYQEWKRRVGCELYEHYGVSEFQLVIGQGPQNPVKPGSIGKPAPGLKVAILDEQDRLVAHGETGYFAISAEEPGLFLGYYRDPATTEAALKGGWYRTGDLAYQDEEGYFCIAGRADDCFKSRGVFISPAEIENALQRHAAVIEAAVVPEPDAEIGNRILAVVVPGEGHLPSAALADTIRDELRGRIAPFKIPHRIEFAPSLPKSAVGKILRGKLTRQSEMS